MMRMSSKDEPKARGPRGAVARVTRNRYVSKAIQRASPSNGLALFIIDSLGADASPAHTEVCLSDAVGSSSIKGCQPTLERMAQNWAHSSLEGQPNTPKYPVTDESLLNRKCS